MPRRKLNIRKRRTYRRKRRTNKSVWKVTTDGGALTSRSFPLPRTFKTTLRYMEKGISLNPGVGGTAADHLFSLNGLYDPNYSGVGHQPLGFDELMNLYTNYTVIGAKASCTFYNIDTANEALVAAVINNSSSPIANLTRAVENGKCAYKMLTKSGDSNASCVINLGANIKKELGINSILGEPVTSGSIATNPSQQVFLHIIAEPNSTNDSAVTGCSVIIDYIVLFHDPLFVVPS